MASELWCAGGGGRVLFHPTALGHPSLGAACPCQAGVPALPDSIGANTVGALWLGGIWLPGSNSPPGEDDDNMLGGEAGLGKKKKNDNVSLRIAVGLFQGAS